MKVQPTGLLSKEQKKRKHTYICAKHVIHTVHDLGKIVNNRNIKQVKNKKKLLWKKIRNNIKILINEWKEHYYTYAC